MKGKLAIGLLGLILFSGNTAGAASGAPVKHFCEAVQGYEQIIENFNSLTQGFNDKNWNAIEPLVSNDITLTRITDKMKKTHKKAKAQYKQHLEDDAWKNNPSWSNVNCDLSDVTSALVKLVATYDFKFDKPQGEKGKTIDSFAVMYFTRSDGKMIDFTVGPLQK
jgi:hypothetical protein